MDPGQSILGSRGCVCEKAVGKKFKLERARHGGMPGGGPAVFGGEQEATGWKKRFCFWRLPRDTAVDEGLVRIMEGLLTSELGIWTLSLWPLCSDTGPSRSLRVLGLCVFSSLCPTPRGRPGSPPRCLEGFVHLTRGLSCLSSL